ncbi:MAG TPA: hypothetical protein VGM89_08715 [Puia sp.]|jgi:hypothetical protein
MRPFLFFVILLGCGLVFSATAQDLKPSELVAMKHYKMVQIDSLMQARGFKKNGTTEDPGFSIFTYLYQGVEGSTPVQRNLQVGLRKSIHVLSLEYGVWSAADSANFVGQLGHDGYRRVVKMLPVIGTPKKTQAVSYKKGMEEISYHEHPESGGKLYLFSVSSEDYQP